MLVSHPCRVAHSACARSLSSCLRFGFSSRASFFFLLAWSGLVACCRVPSSLLPVFPIPCVSCFVLAFAPPSSHPSCSVVSSAPACPPVLASAIAWGVSSHRCRLLASPRRRRFSASCLPCVPSSLLGSSRSVPSYLGLVAFLVRSCLRFALRPALLVVGAGRLAVPWFPIVSCGSLLGGPFLVVARSSVVCRLAPCPPPVVLACFPCLGIVLDGGGCR